MEQVEQAVENVSTSVTNKFNEIMNTGIGNFKVSTICEAILLFIVCVIVIRIVMKIVEKALEKTKLEKHKWK